MFCIERQGMLASVPMVKQSTAPPLMFRRLVYFPALVTGQGSIGWARALVHQSVVKVQQQTLNRPCFNPSTATICPVVIKGPPFPGSALLPQVTSTQCDETRLACFGLSSQPSASDFLCRQQQKSPDHSFVNRASNKQRRRMLL